MNDLDLGTGVRTVGCRRCGIVFTSDSAFDRHLRMRGGESVHLPPEDVGLELKRNGRWGSPARMPLPALTVGSVAANRAACG